MGFYQGAGRVLAGQHPRRAADPGRSSPAEPVDADPRGEEVRPVRPNSASSGVDNERLIPQTLPCDASAPVCANHAQTARGS